MTPTFLFKLGTLDLSQYVRVNPDDRMDPYGPPWLTPAFTETPYAEGQPLLSTTVGNREQQWPVFLHEQSKDLLHQLIQKINIAAGTRPLTVEWEDDSASKPTFYDVAFARFEPDFNFRRSQYGYAAGILHIWVFGYGHTGTIRVAGTAAGTGIFLSVPVASLSGDAPALLDTTITAGAVVPSLGRIVAVSPITNPSYSALIPAGSLLEAQTGATLVGASGAQGSQYLALPISPTGASGIACRIPLQNPTIMGGDNRVLAVVNSGIESGVAITAYDPYGNTLGPTSIASMAAGWGVIDLGVCRLPTVGFPTRPLITIQAGGVWASGQAAPGVNATPGGLAINEVICLPDKNLALILESHAAASQVSKGLSEIFGPLAGSRDESGHTWQPALNNAHPLAGLATGFAPQIEAGAIRPGAVHQQATTLTFDACRLEGIVSDSMLIKGKAWFNNLHFDEPAAASLSEVRLFKDTRASQFVQARMALTGFLSLEAATGGAAGNVLASVQLATISLSHRYNLTLAVAGPQAYVTLARNDGEPVFAPGSMAQASIGVASNAAVPGGGAPAVALAFPSTAEGRFTEELYAWEVTTIPSSNLAAFDSYRVDGPDVDAYRTASSGVFSGAKLVANQRGTFPKAAPSTSSIAVVCAPFDQGAANDTIKAVVSVRERFFYAR